MRRFSYSTNISLPFIRNIKRHNLTEKKNHKQKFFFIALSTDPCRNVNKQCICQISNQKMEFKQTKQNRSCNFYKNQICKILIFRNFIDCNDLLFYCIQKELRRLCNKSCHDLERVYWAIPWPIIRYNTVHYLVGFNLFKCS